MCGNVWARRKEREGGGSNACEEEGSGLKVEEREEREWGRIAKVKIRRGRIRMWKVVTFGFPKNMMDPPETTPKHGRVRHKCALSPPSQLYHTANTPFPQTYINPYINLPSQLYPKHYSNRIPHTPPKVKDACTQTLEHARYTRRKGTQTVTSFHRYHSSKRE